VTPGFVLNELDLDLPSACLLVFGLVIIIVVVAGTVVRILVNHKGIVAHGLGCTGWERLWLGHGVVDLL
jgi:hypothetical protein